MPNDVYDMQKKVTKERKLIVYIPTAHFALPNRTAMSQIITEIMPGRQTILKKRVEWIMRKPMGWQRREMGSMMRGDPLKRMKWPRGNDLRKSRGPFAPIIIIFAQFGSTVL